MTYFHSFFWGIVIVIMLFFAYFFWPQKQFSQKTGMSKIASDAIIDIKLPKILSAQAQLGERIFQGKCAVCHGGNAVGREKIAPPLVHKIYEPSHHSDEAFQRAVALGVQQHHWNFGNMAPVKGLSRNDVQMIIKYIRELQRENGIQ